MFVESEHKGTRNTATLVPDSYLRVLQGTIFPLPAAALGLSFVISPGTLSSLL